MARANGIGTAAHGCLALYVASALAAVALAADGDAAARAVLSGRGLTAYGTLWLSQQEVQLRKRIEGLEQLEKRYRAALQHEKTMLARNEAIRAQLQQAEAAKASGKEPPKKPSTSKSAAEPAATTVKLSSEMPDVTGTPDATPLQAAVIDLVNARQALMLSVLYVRENAGKLEAEYEELRDDRAVSDALTKLGSKHRLGPAKDYQREQSRLDAAAGRVFTDRVPVYRESGRYQIGVVLGEETPATMSFAENSQPTWISANVAQAAGISVPDDAPSESFKIDARTVQARAVKLPQLRIGKYLLKDVATLVLASEDEDLGSQLSSRAIAGYRLKFEPREMTLQLEQTAAASK